LQARIIGMEQSYRGGERKKSHNLSGLSQVKENNSLNPSYKEKYAKSDVLQEIKKPPVSGG
jgi:hypothetical protein